MDENSMPFMFGPNGEFIPGNPYSMANLAQLGQGTGVGIPELPPNPMMLTGQKQLPIPLDSSNPMAGLDLSGGQPPAAAAPATPPADKSLIPEGMDKALKKLGNLTPDQVKSIQGMTGMNDKPALPPAAAAIPRGQLGQMQSLSMAAPQQRKTLGQLINNR